MYPNPQFAADLVTFTEEILNGKLHFLCSAMPCFQIMTLLQMAYKVPFSKGQVCSQKLWPVIT